MDTYTESKKKKSSSDVIVMALASLYHAFIMLACWLLNY